MVACWLLSPSVLSHHRVQSRGTAGFAHLVFTRWVLALAALLAAALSFAPPALAGTTTAFTVPADSAVSGSRARQVKVYVPDGLSAAAPMVMALHGCQQTSDDVLNDWGLKAAADRHRFILVAPFITSYDGLRNTNCWGFWFDQHRHEGRGEPEDLRRIGTAVEARWAVDANRRYITGLSSGGAMAAVAAVTHIEYWAAAASAAGLPYGEDSGSVSFSACPGSATFHTTSRVATDMRAELDDPYAIPLMVLANARDCVVLAQAGRNLRDAQLLVFGDAGHDTPAEAQASQAPCAPFFGSNHGCVHTRYTADGTTATRSRVETVFFSGPLETPNTADTDKGHYWVGGESGLDGKWAVRRGPSFPDIVWDFFARHARDGGGGGGGGGGTGGKPQITLQGANPMTVTRGQAFTDPGATATDPEDGALPVAADCSSVNVNGVGSYACGYRAQDSAGNVATASRTVNVVDTTTTCTNVASSPWQHIMSARAAYGGVFFNRAITTGDRRDIGYAFDTLSRVTLWSTGGRWYAVKPAGCG